MKRIFIILGSENEAPPKISVDVDNSNFNITPGTPNSQETIMLNLIQSDPTLLETDPDIKAWKEQFDNIHGSENEEVVETPNEEVVETPKKVVKKAPAKEENAEVVETPEVKKNPFVKGKKSYEGVNFDNLEEAAKGLGITVADKEQLIPTLLSSYEAQRKNALKATELEKQVKEYDAFLVGLPPKLKSTIKAYSDGRDWEASLAAADPNNYEKNFDSLNTAEKALAVKTLVGVDLSANDLSKDDNKKTVELAEKAYSIKQKELKLSAEQIKSNQLSLQKDRDSRIESSILNLKNSIPDIDDEFVTQVEDVIKNKGIGSLFTDKDGKLLPDAAKKILFALHGDTLLENSTNSAEAKGANKEREKVIKDNISEGANAKSKSNNVTKAEEDILTSQRNITRMYKQTY